MEKKKDLLLYLVFLAYIVAAVVVYNLLPFLEAAAADGALFALFLVLGIFRYRNEGDQEGGWGCIEKGRKRTE